MLYVKQYNKQSLDRSSISTVDYYKRLITILNNDTDDLTTSLTQLLALIQDLRERLTADKKEIQSDLNTTKEDAKKAHINADSTIQAIQEILDSAEKELENLEEDVEANLNCEAEYGSCNEDCAEACIEDCLEDCLEDCAEGCGEATCIHCEHDNCEFNGECLYELNCNEEHPIEECGANYSDGHCTYMPEGDCSQSGTCSGDFSQPGCFYSGDCLGNFDSNYCSYSGTCGGSYSTEGCAYNGECSGSFSSGNQCNHCDDGDPSCQWNNACSESTECTFDDCAETCAYNPSCDQNLICGESGCDESCGDCSQCDDDCDLECWEDCGDYDCGECHEGDW